MSSIAPHNTPNPEALTVPMAIYAPQLPSHLYDGKIRVLTAKLPELNPYWQPRHPKPNPVTQPNADILMKRQLANQALANAKKVHSMGHPGQTPPGRPQNMNPYNAPPGMNPPGMANMNPYSAQPQPGGNAPPGMNPPGMASMNPSGIQSMTRDAINQLGAQHLRPPSSFRPMSAPRHMSFNQNGLSDSLEAFFHGPEALRAQPIDDAWFTTNSHHYQQIVNMFQKQVPNSFSQWSAAIVDTNTPFTSIDAVLLTICGYIYQFSQRFWEAVAHAYQTNEYDTSWTQPKWKDELKIQKLLVIDTPDYWVAISRMKKASQKSQSSVMAADPTVSLQEQKQWLPWFYQTKTLESILRVNIAQKLTDMRAEFKKSQGATQCTDETKGPLCATWSDQTIGSVPLNNLAMYAFAMSCAQDFDSTVNGNSGLVRCAQTNKQLSWSFDENIILNFFQRFLLGDHNVPFRFPRANPCHTFFLSMVYLRENYEQVFQKQDTLQDVIYTLASDMRNTLKDYILTPITLNRPQLLAKFEHDFSINADREHAVIQIYLILCTCFFANQCVEQTGWDAQTIKNVFESVSQQQTRARRSLTVTEYHGPNSATEKSSCAIQ